mgnify:CR=1 FL=1
MKTSKSLKFNNTYDRGVMTFLVGPENGKFVGVILEFDLIVYADTFEQAKKEIVDYGWLWLRNARKNKLPEEVLNRPAPKKYWKIHEILVEADKQKQDAEKRNTNIPIHDAQNIAKIQFPYSPNLNFAQ